MSLLDEIMVVQEQPDSELVDTKGKGILDNFRRYTIKPASFNVVNAWQGIKKTICQ
jgi:hypothetical protein